MTNDECQMPNGENAELTEGGQQLGGECISRIDGERGACVRAPRMFAHPRRREIEEVSPTQPSTHTTPPT